MVTDKEQQPQPANLVGSPLKGELEGAASSPLKGELEGAVHSLPSSSGEGSGEGALSLFMQGYGCCQSVVAAFADRYGLDRDMALRVAAGFGGGVGRMRMMCGACSALTILAGLEKGQTRGDDREGKAACYQLTRDLLEAFRQENGSIICAELLQMAGCQAVTDTNLPDDRNAEYYKRRPCARKVVSAARIFEQYLAQEATAQEAK